MCQQDKSNIRSLIPEMVLHYHHSIFCNIGDQKWVGILKVIEEIRTEIFIKNVNENLMLCIYLVSLLFINCISVSKVLSNLYFFHN